MAFQNYPRLESGLMDVETLVPHTKTLTKEELRKIILEAIVVANQKSSTAILNIPEDASEQEISKHYVKSGSDLFKYFVQYWLLLAPTE